MSFSQLLTQQRVQVRLPFFVFGLVVVLPLGFTGGGYSAAVLLQYYYSAAALLQYYYSAVVLLQYYYSAAVLLQYYYSAAVPLQYYYSPMLFTLKPLLFWLVPMFLH